MNQYIAKNKRSDVVNKLGRFFFDKICDLADVYRFDNIIHVSDDFIQSAGITEGSFDNISSASYTVSNHGDIGKMLYIIRS